MRRAAAAALATLTGIGASSRPSTAQPTGAKPADGEPPIAATEPAPTADAIQPATTTSPVDLAAAEPRLALPVDVTASMVAGWHTDRDYGDVFGRFNLSRAWDAWRASLRLDTSTFVESPDDAIESRYTAEKAALEWTGRSFEITAGDSYVSFGRGLGLSLRKLDELGIDTTLRGAKLLVHHGRIAGTAAAGYVNIHNIDEATGTGADDPYDLVGGVQGQVAVGDGVTVGAYGAAVWFRDGIGLVPTDDYRDRSLQYGITVDAPRATRHLGFYLEAMGQAIDAQPAADHPRGFGLYGAAMIEAGRAAILFEGKAYGALTPVKPNLDAPAFDAVAYTSPPTVERVLQTIENPATEIAGGRLRADWSFSPSLIAFVNYGVFRDWHGYADPDGGGIRPGTIHDPYAGVEARWDQARSWAIGSAGWRVVVLDGSREQVRRDGHLELDAAQSLGSLLTATLHVLHEERAKHESALLDERFRQGTLTAGFRLRPSLTVAGGYDYTTEPTQPKRDYFSSAIGWDFTPSSSARLQVGSMRGGLTCISGVCRVLPPFEGVKLTATLRF